jgi:hypothetical protein
MAHVRRKFNDTLQQAPVIESHPILARIKKALLKFKANILP